MFLTVVQVQSFENTSTSSSTIQVNLSTTAGNLLFVVAGQESNATDSCTISDSAGQTWTAIQSNTAPGIGMQQYAFYKPSSAAVSWVKATFTNSDAATTIIVYEISGADPTSPLDSGANTLNSSASSAGSETSSPFSTAGANELIINCVQTAGAMGTWTPGSIAGTTAISLAGSTYSRISTEYVIANAQQTNVTASASWSSARAWSAMVQAFKASSSPPPSGLYVIQAQDNINTASGQTSLTVPIGTTSGNLLVAVAREGTNNTDNFTISDSAVNTWTQVDGYIQGNTTNRAGMFYAKNAAPVSWVKASFTTVGGVVSTAMVVYEIDGADPSNPLDTSGATSNSSYSAFPTTVTSPAITTAQPQEIMIFAVTTGANITAWAAGSGDTIPPNGTNARWGTEFQIFSTVKTSFTTTLVIQSGSTGSLSDIIAAFKAATVVTWDPASGGTWDHEETVSRLASGYSFDVSDLHHDDGIPRLWDPSAHGTWDYDETVPQVAYRNSPGITDYPREDDVPPIILPFNVWDNVEDNQCAIQANPYQNTPDKDENYFQIVPSSGFDYGLDGYGGDGYGGTTLGEDRQIVSFNVAAYQIVCDTDEASRAAWTIPSWNPALGGGDDAQIVAINANPYQFAQEVDESYLKLLPRVPVIDDPLDVAVNANPYQVSADQDECYYTILPFPPSFVFDDAQVVSVNANAYQSIQDQDESDLQALPMVPVIDDIQDVAINACPYTVTADQDESLYVTWYIPPGSYNPANNYGDEAQVVLINANPYQVVQDQDESWPSSLPYLPLGDDAQVVAINANPYQTIADQDESYFSKLPLLPIADDPRVVAINANPYQITQDQDETCFSSWTTPPWNPHTGGGDDAQVVLVNANPYQVMQDIDQSYVRSLPVVPVDDSAQVVRIDANPYHSDQDVDDSFEAAWYVPPAPPPPPPPPLAPHAPMAGDTYIAALPSDIISQAYTEIGHLAQGETLSGADLDWGLGKLQRIIDRLGTRKEFIYVQTFNLCTLIPYHQPHTIGPADQGADWGWPQRPVSIQSASIVFPQASYGPLDLPIRVVDKDRWAIERVKLFNSQFPVYCYYEPTAPLGSLYFWPIPQNAYQARLELYVNLPQAIDAVTAMQLPPGYLQFLIYALAVALCNSEGKDVPQDLMELYRNARKSIYAATNQPPRTNMLRGLAKVKSRPTYNFLTGEHE